MALTDEQIQRALDWFANSSEIYRNWAPSRKIFLQENNKWIQPESIKNLSDEELERKFLDYFNNNTRQVLNKIYRDRIIRDKKRFRDVMAFALDESVDIKTRLDEILDGSYHIEGFGRAILTSFLMDFKPEKYCLWNNKTEMGFAVLGWEVYENRDPWGVAYLKVLETLQRLRDLNAEYNLSFGDVDLFLHTISAEEEGIRMVKVMADGGVLEETTDESLETSPKTESMEFVIEKYLEEFIEANFSKIYFGAKLELYQDEENSSGRQFQTTIGRIDLLAIDKQKKEFVVIELKKGRSGDVVVGQILRYMGWVKENLAKDEYTVRGIAIVKEKDDKLEYALSQMPTVELFFYNVSFDLKKTPPSKMPPFRPLIDSHH